MLDKVISNTCILFKVLVQYFLCKVKIACNSTALLPPDYIFHIFLNIELNKLKLSSTSTQEFLHEFQDQNNLYTITFQIDRENHAILSNFVIIIIENELSKRPRLIFALKNTWLGQPRPCEFLQLTSWGVVTRSSTISTKRRGGF